MTKTVASNEATPRRRPLRLANYDYGQAGFYFLTICTHKKVCLFGDAANGEMHLNTAGKIVDACWYDLTDHYPHIELDAFVIMPNHIHGVLVLTDRPVDPGSVSKHHGLPEIVRAFKTFSARKINVLRGKSGTRLWQRNYYEHIIRNEISLNEIRRYIEENPIRWDLDRENPLNARRSE